MKRGPYEVITSREVYKNLWISLREDSIIRHNGEEGIFGIVESLSGVSIVALNEKKEIYLIKEYAYAIDRYTIGIPTGGVDENETLLDAAKRELQEETGLVAADWIELGHIDPYTMIVKGPQHLFLALGVKKETEKEAEIELLTMPFTEAYNMVMESSITHAGSAMAIMKAKEYLEKN